MGPFSFRSTAFWSAVTVVAGVAAFALAILAQLPIAANETGRVLLTGFIVLAVTITIAAGLVWRELRRSASAAGQLMAIARRLADPAEADADEAAVGAGIAGAVGEVSRRAGEAEGWLLERDTERAQMGALITHMADGVLIVDGNEHILQANPAAERLLATRAGSDAPRTLADFARDHEVVDLVRTARLNNQAEERVLDVGLNREPVRVVATPVQESGGEWVVILLQDLSGIQAADTVRREFVANVSHELRSPITSMKALAETLQEGAVDDPGVRGDFLVRIQTEADRLAQMVEELLELARIEAGRDRLQRASCDMDDIVRRAAERLRPLAERAKLQLEAPPEHAHTEVHADPEMLDRIVTNILHNAVKFTPPGGRITARVDRRAGRVLLSIEDSGVGIAAADLPRLFERFYKADRSRSDGGTGLGLAIARHLVDRHDGEIWADSPGPERGATFFVSLPGAATPAGDEC
ncbi:MAG: ATP-binding protein [Chloroflexota bacterium]|nr:ATP-binding protein [Chloroflexota bacterium]